MLPVTETPLFEEMGAETFAAYYQNKKGPILFLCVINAVLALMLYFESTREIFDIREIFIIFLTFCGTVIAIGRWLRVPRIKIRIEPSGISAFDFWRSKDRFFTWRQVKSVELLNGIPDTIVLRIKNYASGSFLDSLVGTREPVFKVADRDAAALIQRLEQMREKYGQ